MTTTREIKSPTVKQRTFSSKLWHCPCRVFVGEGPRRPSVRSVDCVESWREWEAPGTWGDPASTGRWTVTSLSAWTPCWRPTVSSTPSVWRQTGHLRTKWTSSVAQSSPTTTPSPLRRGGGRTSSISKLASASDQASRLSKKSLRKMSINIQPFSTWRLVLLSVWMKLIFTPDRYRGLWVRRGRSRGLDQFRSSGKCGSDRYRATCGLSARGPEVMWRAPWCRQHQAL